MMRVRTYLALISVPVTIATLGGGGIAMTRGAPALEGDDEPLVTAVQQLDRTTQWRLVDRIPLDFETYHPQGFAIVGDKIFMSSVEVIEPPVRFPEPVDGYDRTPGKGIGHVFVMTRDGELIRDIVVGEGPDSTIYHPGGLDYDGHDVWVPVAEYRPDSAAIVYRIDPDTYEVTREFGYRDHVGGVVVDRVTHEVRGVTWGSRRMIRWSPDGRVRDVALNQSHFVDYQDCAYVASRKQLCSGVTGFTTASGGSFELGGLALIDLRDNEILHETPMPGFSSAGHSVTRNPVAVELDGDTVRLLAAPDDGEEVAGTELLVYEADLSDG
jgi:hypothetical protein